MHLKDLKSKSPSELLKIAEDLKIENAGTMRKQDMIFSILKQMALNNDAIYGEGVLEILQDGFGFLRSSDANYLPGPDDIYVSPTQIKQNSLRTGDTVEGEMRSPRDTERYFAITKIDKINFESVEKTKQRINFDNLTPLYPDEKLKMEVENPMEKDITHRVMDLIAPLGKGQRALIVVSSSDRKNCHVTKYCSFYNIQSPEVYLIVLPIDERPEEVTDMIRSVKGGGCFLNI